MTTAEIAGASARPLRTIAGEGMVTARRAVTVTYRDGRTERITPKRDRFAPTHPLVQANPDRFELCCKDDRSQAPNELRAAQVRQRSRGGKDATASLATGTTTKPIFGMSGYHRTTRPTARPAWML